MTAREAVCLNESVPQLQVPQAADTYLFPRDCAFTTAVLTSSVADGASAVGFTLNTAALSTSGAMALRVNNNTTSLFQVTKDGGVHIMDGTHTGVHSQGVSMIFNNDGIRGARAQGAAAFGWGSTASGNYSFAAGYYSTASGGNSFAGVAGTASGDNSCAIGNEITVSGAGSAMFGFRGSTANESTLGIGGGDESGGGAYKSCLMKVTTDDTQTELLASSSNFVVPADTVWGFRAIVVGRSNEADGNDCACYEIVGAIKRDESNNTALVGSITKTVIAEDAGATGWDATVEANDTNETLAVKVTGEASTTIKWAAMVDYVQVTYA